MWVVRSAFWCLFVAGVAMLRMASPAAATSDGGWEYLRDKLVADGVDPARVDAVFEDPRLGTFAGLEFSLGGHGERRSMYSGFLRPMSVAEARRCRAQYDRELSTAEQRFGVPASVVAALLHVETHCGRNTGSRVVFARLATLAMANEPANVARNIDRHSQGVPPARQSEVEQRVRLRARELESVFYPEVLAMFTLAEQGGIDPLALRGSGSGAFGLPQFLPTSYLHFAIDGNGDGRISLDDPADAIASSANYLARHGWHPGITHAQERQVIWTYNHSDPYIDTVLALAARIDGVQPAREPAAASAKRRGARPAHGTSPHRTRPLGAHART